MADQVHPVVRALAEVPSRPQELSQDDLTLHDNTPGERSLIAEYKARRPFGLRQDAVFDLNLIAYESFSTDGSAGNTETFNLGHDLVDAVAVADDFVLYEGPNEVQPDSVDYSADSFDYTDDGTNNTLHAFYVSSDQAHVEIEKHAPSNHYAGLDERDAGLVNLRDQGRDPLSFDFGDPLGGVVPTDWRVEVYVNAPYQITWSKEGGDATPRNALITFPIRRSEQEIERLEDIVIQRLDEV